MRRDRLFWPALPVPKAAELSGLTYPTVATAFRHLERLGIVRQVKRVRRGRVYVYSAYLKLLDEGTGPEER